MRSPCCWMRRANAGSIIPDSRRGQGLRHEGLRGSHAHPRRYPARGAEHQRALPSDIDGHTTRHRGYDLSQRLRKRVEEVLGWMKTVGGFRRTRYRGLDRTDLTGSLVGTAYNLARIARLLTSETPAPRATLTASPSTERPLLTSGHEAGAIYTPSDGPTTRGSTPLRSCQ